MTQTNWNYTPPIDPFRLVRVVTQGDWQFRFSDTWRYVCNSDLCSFQTVGVSLEEVQWQIDNHDKRCIYAHLHSNAKPEGRRTLNLTEVEIMWNVLDEAYAKLLAEPSELQQGICRGVAMSIWAQLSARKSESYDKKIKCLDDVIAEAVERNERISRGDIPNPILPWYYMPTRTGLMDAVAASIPAKPLSESMTIEQYEGIKRGITAGMSDDVLAAAMTIKKVYITRVRKSEPYEGRNINA